MKLPGRRRSKPDANFSFLSHRFDGNKKPGRPFTG
jgi:hypothetical protein